MTALLPALARSIALRAPLLSSLHAGDTDCYRLHHGAVEGTPGTAVDRYGPVVLIQTWRDPLTDPAEATLACVQRALQDQGLPVPDRVVWNHRPRGDTTHWPPDPSATMGRELGLEVDVRPRHRGRDPLLFLDLRAGRRWIRAEARGRTVLNLFAYTCGIGLAADAGGARAVWNVDFASSALAVGRANAQTNGLTGQTFIEEDVFPVVRQLGGLALRDRRRGPRPRYTRRAAQQFDIVVLDPPRWATSPFGAVDLVRDYPSLLKPALLATSPGGRLLITNNVAAVDREEWRSLCIRCGAKAGRPLAAWDWLPPEDDYPSPDGNPPLKMALLTLKGDTHG